MSTNELLTWSQNVLSQVIIDRLSDQWNGRGNCSESVRCPELSEDNQCRRI